MISPEWRFFSPEGALFPGGPHAWSVIDWDQRRWIAVTGPAEALPDDDDGVEMVARHINQLGPDVYSFKVSLNGDLLSTSTAPDDDPTWEVRYPDYPGEKKEGEVIRRSELAEVDRLHVCTDLVKYKQEAVAFKYTIMQQHVKNIWDELHTLKALRGHESFVQFHHAILDDVSDKVLGLTSQYISGGTLEEYRDRPLYFRWLNQLTSAIDDLNLRFGIMHQDVAPRNILVDPITETLKIFDFDCSALIGSPDQMPGRDDVDHVIFTVYETLTKDDQYRSIPFDEQDVRQVETLDEWKLDKVPLEDGHGDISTYRQFLTERARGRRTTRTIKLHCEAAEPASWLAYLGLESLMLCNEGGRPLKVLRRQRQFVLRRGEYVTCWERPPQKQSTAARLGGDD